MTRSARWSGRSNASCAVLIAFSRRVYSARTAERVRVRSSGSRSTVRCVEVRTDLVSGSAYAPAEPYAEALGAAYRYDARTGVLLSFGGRFLSLQSFPTVKQAAAATTALTVDGQQPSEYGRGASTDESVYLPVKSVTAALGGRTAYLAAAKTVAVVFPRPTLTRGVAAESLGKLRAVRPDL